MRRIPEFKRSLMTDTKHIVLEQVASGIGRSADQRQTLVGLGLNRIGRRVSVKDTPAARGMIAKVAHLVRVVEGQ
jgi:large subunit ribosomal protein L30